MFSLPQKDELKVDEKLPEIVPIKSAALSSSSTAPVNGKRKVTVLSDDDESGSYSNDKDEDSFEDMPLKKKKILWNITTINLKELSIKDHCCSSLKHTH